MNTTFRISGDYEIEITTDGSLPNRNPDCCSSVHRGLIGVGLHHVGFEAVPMADGSPAERAVPVNRTKGAIFLKRNQARAIASALLNAVAEVSEPAA